MTADKKTEGALPAWVKAGVRDGTRETVGHLVTSGLADFEKRSRGGRLYASEAGYCERQGTVLAITESHELSSASSTMYKLLGDSIEKLVLDALYTQDVLLFRQFHIPEVGLDLGGYIDAIVYLNGKITALEVKSCGQLPSSPKPQHLHQAAIYSAITGLPAILYYVSRHVAGYDGTLKQAEFFIPVNGEVQRNALYRAALSHLCVLEGVTPNKPSHLKDEGDCGFCPLKPQCWHDAERLGWPEDISPSLAMSLTREATALVDDLLSREATQERRNGILKHLSRAGNSTAKTLLRERDWAPLVYPIR